jgi:hypothetical protein
MIQVKILQKPREIERKVLVEIHKKNQRKRSKTTGTEMGKEMWKHFKLYNKSRRFQYSFMIYLALKGLSYENEQVVKTMTHLIKKYPVSPYLCFSISLYFWFSSLQI